MSFKTPVTEIFEFFSFQSIGVGRNCMPTAKKRKLSDGNSRTTTHAERY